MAAVVRAGHAGLLMLDWWGFSKATAWCAKRRILYLRPAIRFHEGRRAPLNTPTVASARS